MWRVTWSSTALVDLERFGRNVSERVVDAIVDLVRDGRGDVRHVPGAGDEWRLRVGDYRGRFTIDRENGLVTMLHVFMHPA